jgi:hypothetical protein
VRFCQLNPGNLARNFDKLQILIDNLAMDVICISETWLKKHHSDKKFRMNGFKLFRADRGVYTVVGVVVSVLGTLINTSSAGTGSNPTIGIQCSIVAVDFYRTLIVR